MQGQSLSGMHPRAPGSWPREALNASIGRTKGMSSQFLPGEEREGEGRSAPALKRSLMTLHESF